MWDAYLVPVSVEDALQMLSSRAGQARIIAGGTDLVLQSKRGQCSDRVVVDITRMPGWGFIEERDGWVHIGCQVTHCQVARSPLIRNKAYLLGEACASVGGPQIRRVATLVGNVTNGLPAADGAIALAALGAEAEIATLEGRVWRPIIDLYAGVGKCNVDAHCAIVTQLRFPALQAREAGAFARLARRRALTLPTLNAAAVVGLEDGRIARARIALGPVSTTPFLASQAADFLVGRSGSREDLDEAARLAAVEAKPRASLLRGGAEYRRAMVAVLVRRTLAQSLERLSGTE